METVELRSRSAQTLGVLTMAVAAVGLASAVLDGLDVVVRYGAAMLLLGVGAWAALWRPMVAISDGEVLVVNVLRTVHVPWPAIETVEGRYGLQLRTAYGAVTAWAAQAPAGRQRSRGEESEAATVVKQRLQYLTDAGHLDGRRLERVSLRVEWHRAQLVALLALAAATVGLPFVA